MIKIANKTQICLIDDVQLKEFKFIHAMNIFS